MKKIIITILVLAVIGFGAYYIINNNSSGTPAYNSPVSNNPSQASQTSAASLPNATSSATNVSTSINTTTTPPIPKTSPTPKLSSVSVSIQNFSFSPSTLNIKIGTKVTWINNDNVSHTVTSDSGNLLNSGTLSPGQSFSFTFTNTGSVNYHCAIHPMMKGSVVVGN